MNGLVLAPVIVPLAAAALGLAAWRSTRSQSLVGVVGAGGLLAASLALLITVERDGILTLQVGDWPAPYGITFVADLFSAILVVLAGVLGLAVAVYSTASIDEGRVRHGYFPLLLVLLAGVSGSFLTGDLFNLYVWFEVLLIASFVLLALGGERAQLEGALKYVTLNLVASALLLASIGVLYGMTGTVNLADLSERMKEVAPDGIVTGVAVLLVVAFGIKAALVPLYFWLPASYHTPPVAVAAIFGGLLTKVGVYALVRMLTLVLPDEAVTLQPLLLVAAALTMVVGVVGAIAHYEIRRILSFLIVSEIGFLVMGLGLFTVPALAAVVFFLVNVAIAKAALFLVAGVVERLTGTFELARTGGLYASRPGFTVLFGVAALSLTGIPPFAGFLAKLALVQAGLAVGQGAVVAVSLLVSLLTLYAMLRIWDAAFWRPLPVSEPATSAREDRGAGDAPLTTGGLDERRVPARMLGPVSFLAAWSIALSVAAGPMFALVDRAASQLMDPTDYVDAVLRTVAP